MVLKVAYIQMKKKKTQRKGRPGILTDRSKVSDRLYLQVLSPKEILQRLPIALTEKQVKHLKTY